MNEEIVARFGADTGPIDKAMRGLRSSMTSFGKEIGGNLAAAFSIGGAVALLEKAMTKVQSIKRMSESLGASTGFVQDITNVGMAAGISGESIEKMMDKFIKGLPAGSDIEEKFYQLSERLKGIEDPSERARIAIESFGKSGVKMIAVMGQGADAVRGLAAQFSKFSESDIRALEEAKQAHERFGNWLVTWSGRLIIGFKFIGLNLWGGITRDFSALKKMLEEGANAKTSEASESSARKTAESAVAKAESDKESLDAIIAYKRHLDEIALKSDEISHAEKIAILNRQKAFEEHGVVAAPTEKLRYEALAKVKDLELKITEEKKKQHEEDLKALRVAQEKSNAEAAIGKAQRRLDRSRADFTKLSLEDLAGMGDSRTALQMGYSGIGADSRPGISPFMQMARQAIWERDQSTLANASGNFEWARQHQQNYENLVKNNPALKESVREPFKDLEQSVRDHTTRMEELLDRTGIVVREIDGTE